MSRSGPSLARVSAVAALILAAIVLLTLLTSDGTYRVSGVFEDVRGLIEGGEVKAGSAVVGSVETIEFNDDEMPVVTMKVDEDLELRQGAYADIRLASNVGGVNRFVDLEVGEGEPLHDGAMLGPSQTDQPVDIDLAVSELTPRVRDDVARFLSGLEASLRDNGANLDRAFRHSATSLAESADLLAEVNEDGLALKTLVSEGRTVVGAMARSRGDLGLAADRLAEVLTITAARQLELRRATRALGPGLASGRVALERMVRALPNLQALAEASRPAVAELRPTAREILPAFDAMRPLLDEASKLIAESPAQLRRLRPVIKASLPVVRRLEPTLDRIGPFVDYLRTWAPEIVSFFTLFGDATASYDANGHLIRSTAIAIQAARHTNEIDADENVPGLVERPYARTPGSLEGEPWGDYEDFFIGGAERPEDLLDDRDVP